MEKPLEPSPSTVMRLKQPPTAASASSYKLWLSLILGVPIAALIAFSLVLVSNKWEVLLEMNEINNASHLINRSSSLVHELQKERGYTAGFIASKGAAFKAELLKQRAATDRLHALFAAEYSAVNRKALHPAIISNFDQAIAEIARIGEVRRAADMMDITYFGALEYYTNANSLMLDTVGIISPLITDRTISSYYFAYFHLEEIKEKAGQQRAALTHAFELGKFLPGQFERFLGIVEAETYSQRQFLALAPPDIQQAYLKVSSVPEVQQADWMKQTAIIKGTQGNFRMDAAYWNAVQTIKIDKLNDVCALFLKLTTGEVDARLAEARHSLISYLLVNLAVVAFAVSMAVMLVGNMAKRREAEESLALHATRMENALSRAEDVLTAIATSPDVIPFFTVSPVYRSVRSVGGGDIVKWVRFRSQYAGLYLHDVAGHDIEEILLNILAASLVDACKTNPEKKSASAPSVFMSRMNEHLTKYCEGRPDYLTAIYLLMDFEDRAVKLATAGHPPPWLITPGGSVRQIDVPAGFIIGQFTIVPTTNDRYLDAVFRPETGQLLLVCSDGLMEQKDLAGTTFEAKFTREIGPKVAGLEPSAAFEIVKNAFEAHLGGGRPEDDVSFIILGSRPADKYHTRRFVPGPELLSLITSHRISREDGMDAAAKHNFLKNAAPASENAGAVVMHKLSDSYEHIIERLKNAGWAPGRVSEVELAVSEMVINAVMHGNMCCDRCAVEISYALHEDVLELSVTDEGPGFDSRTLPQSIEENLLREGGRGHHMITAMADGLYFNDAGNRCWAIFTKEPLPG